MCGIVGYVGKRNVISILVDGLKRLEYRGYDSAGVAFWDKEGIRVFKIAGKVAELERMLIGFGFKFKHRDSSYSLGNARDTK
jgi:glutamine---fructose-6-phosphate transaminase (isomerizing)